MFMGKMVKRCFFYCILYFICSRWGWWWKGLCQLPASRFLLVVRRARWGLWWWWWGSWRLKITARDDDDCDGAGAIWELHIIDEYLRWGGGEVELLEKKEGKGTHSIRGWWCWWWWFHWWWWWTIIDGDNYDIVRSLQEDKEKCRDSIQRLMRVNSIMISPSS